VQRESGEEESVQDEITNFKKIGKIRVLPYPREEPEYN
jgi:hypothetical protein